MRYADPVLKPILNKATELSEIEIAERDHVTAMDIVHGSSITCNHLDDSATIFMPAKRGKLKHKRNSKHRKGKATSTTKNGDHVFVDQFLNSLMDGPRSSYFKKSGGDTVCTLPEGSEVKVVASRTIDLEDTANFQSLCGWQSLDSILGLEEEVEKTSPPVVKKSVGTASEMKAALKYAEETKLFPPDIELKSQYHVDFLYAHFCRLSSPERLKTADADAWKAVIRKNLDVMQDTIGKMGCGPYSFELVAGSKPVRCKSYPLSPVKKDALTKMLKVLMENDILEVATTAEWNSPLLLVSKGDGRWRLVIDYRRVNMLIQNAAVVYPRPDDLFETVQDAYFMFLIDGRDFYFQREIAAHLRPITAFQTHILAYQWKRMPQGLKPSSAAAINPVTELLQIALHVWALLHCDDFLGWAKTEKSSIERFDWVLTKFREFGMTLGWFKIWILLERAEYVSHVIDRGRVYPSPKMVSAIQGIQPPTTVKLVQTFIGMCGYFALYIPMMAHYRAKLTELTKKDLTWTSTTWTAEHQTAFERIKDLLKSACVYIIDWSLPVLLVTDASAYALGGCLLQRDKEGTYRPLRFMSRSLDKFERMQENREREMRAGLYCMIKCNSILAHNLFTWVTDHANIRWVMQAKTENQRVARLALWLSMYWYNIQHGAGDSALIMIADALSRLFIINAEDDSEIFVPFEDKTVQNILLQAISDDIIMSPARFSMTTDTEAHLTRSSAEVVPRSMRVVQHEQERCGCLVCAEQAYAVEEEQIEPLVNLLAIGGGESDRYTGGCSDYGETFLNALDIFPTAGISTRSLIKYGYNVAGVVEHNVDWHRSLLEIAPQTAVYSSITGFGDAISSRSIELPEINLIHAAVSTLSANKSECTGRQTEVSVVLRLLQSVNAQQAPVPLVILTFAKRGKLRALDRDRDLIEAMGYAVQVQSMPSTQFGAMISSAPVVLFLRFVKGPIAAIPVITPPQSYSKIATALTTLSTYQLPLVSSTGAVINPKTLPVNQGHPHVVALHSGGVLQSVQYPIMQIGDALPLLVVNSTAPLDQWKYRRLTVQELLEACGVPDAIRPVLLTMHLQFILSTCSQAVHPNILDSVFATAKLVSKVGGVRETHADCVNTSFCNLSHIRTDDGVSTSDLVLPVAIPPTGKVKRKRNHKPDSSNSSPVMYEFFCGTATLATVFEAYGWKVVTVDLNGDLAGPTSKHPMVERDILDLGESEIKAMFKSHGLPKYIHFAPPCSARSREHRRNVHYTQSQGRYIPRSTLARLADACVAKTFAIIDVAKELNSDVLFTIESPIYRSFQQLPRVSDLVASGDVNYLNLNDYDYFNFSQKPSCWINNVSEWKSKPRRMLPNCSNNQFGRHNSRQRNSYPQQLCEEVCKAVVAQLEVATVAPMVTKSQHKKAQAEAAAKAKASDGVDAGDGDDEPDKDSVHDSDMDETDNGDSSNLDSDIEGRQPTDENEYYVSLEQVREAQSSDPVLKKYRVIAEAKQLVTKWKAKQSEELGSDLSKEIAEAQAEYHLQWSKLVKDKVARGQSMHMYIEEDVHGGVVVFGMANKHWPVPVINSELGKKVIDQAHESLLNLHLGSRKMLSWIRERYWWSSMHSDIAIHTKTCKVCQKMKFASSPGYGFMQMRCYDRPGRCICIDIVVLGHESSKGTKYIFTILDSFSHYADAYCMKDSLAETCARCILYWCQYNGMPEEIRSDGGSNLNVSEVVKALYVLLGIDSTVTHPYAPQGNTVERFHRWLGSALRILFYERDIDVDEALPYILWIFRGTANRMTQHTPFALHLGREVRFPLDVFDSSVAHLTPHEYSAHIKEVMQTLWKDTRMAQEIAQEESAKYYNKRHGVMRKIVVGMKVLRQKLPTNPGDVSTHILPRCSGPYRVLKISSMGTEIKHMVTGAVNKCSLRQIKPFHTRPLEDEDEDEEGQTLFTEGQLVIIRLKTASDAKRKWQVAQLKHTTLDQDAWLIQWYNSPDTCDMLDMKYYPAWEKPSGVEVFQKKPKQGWTPVEWTVYKGRFISPAFTLRSNSKLPPHIRALITAHPCSKKPSAKTK